MAERSKRRRLANASSPSSKKPILNVFSQDPSQPATADDRIRWRGFCEIESDPAFFNVMLRDFGVEGVKVQEVVSLDQDILACLPRPVYGLIFLFRWREEDIDKQEASCPKGIWFANQTINNACASVALLNIVNNIPELDLGEHLQQFKTFTADFTPALRGDAIANFGFVKSIHNSFARKMDMLNADLQLKNDAFSRTKSKAKGSDEDNAGFHFIAFVPVQGKVWKLDGLQRQPQNLGSVTNEDWVDYVAPELQSRMAEYEEGQIDFAILALVKEPKVNLIAALAENVKSILSLSERLDHVKPDWKDFLPSNSDGSSAANHDTLFGPCEHCELHQEAIDQAKLSTALAVKIESDVAEDLVKSRQKLITAQTSLRVSLDEERSTIQTDSERAASRRNDKGLLARGLLQVLERMGKIQAVFDCEMDH
ncbi:MAG: hypothetical protein LQ346_008943 [Caloplaca aetnensis]|nr:MAG: hypothetical protein LQ346_008943 [Caloplaca aetnensis]